MLTIPFFLLRRRKDDGVLQRPGAHDHVSSRPAEPGWLEAHRCTSRYAVGDQVPKGDCYSELGIFICRSIYKMCPRHYLLYAI
jgi:hypothetical protein